MRNPLAKPKGLGPEYAAQFRDQSVAAAYPNRPPYPPEVFDILLGLVRDEPPVVLDLGCGTGDISRGLAPYGMRVDAVDPSSAMLESGQALPGGRHPNIRWITSTAEDFTYPRPYALVVAAESLHWMDWYTVLPRISRSLTPSWTTRDCPRPGLSS
jgi:trans-aconitate methyltransferase